MAVAAPLEEFSLGYHSRFLTARADHGTLGRLCNSSSLSETARIAP